MGSPSGKPATFDAYYLADFRSLTWFAIRIGASSVDEAEDLVQDVMRTVLNQWAQIEAPHAYARAAVRREICRVRTRTTRRHDAEVRAAAQTLQQRSPFDEDTTTVLAMLRTLPPAQRAVLALTTDGYEPGEIAEITGQNTATVRSNLRHARQNLKRLMADTAGREFDGP
ncbi:RNA polymerase sigma factor [Actinoplanes subglobosus]|uniref:RNA polymerase sigma factor n=1 Tax=Actinoplanes subglobosus TaxID=1547892 RepID=A0ABV8J2I7_9ACTN